MRDKYCNNCERVLANLEHIRRERDRLAAIAEKLAEALKFYAEKNHARFLGEIDVGLVRTTRVEGCVETGYYARKALTEYRAFKEGK